MQDYYISVVSFLGYRKYRNDYRLEPQLNRKGKLRNVAVYSGAYYRFLHPLPEVCRAKWQLAVVQALVTVTLLLPLCVRCGYTEQIYVILPFAAGFIPDYLLWAGFWRVHTAQAAVTREHCEKASKRIVNASVFQLVTSALIVLASLVFLLRKQAEIVDWMFAALSLPRLGAAYLTFCLRNAFAMVPVENKSAPDEQTL